MNITETINFLEVISSTATSIRLFLSLPQSSTPYGINCTTTSSRAAGNSLDSSVLSYSQCSYYLVEKSASSLTVAGLTPASNYQCCVQDLENNKLECEAARTLEATGTGGLSSAVAGIVGGIIGAVIILAVLIAVAGIILAILYYRKQQKKM